LITSRARCDRTLCCAKKMLPGPLRAGGVSSNREALRCALGSMWERAMSGLGSRTRLRRYRDLAINI
jgi:hypothetical protein